MEDSNSFSAEMSALALSHNESEEALSRLRTIAEQNPHILNEVFGNGRLLGKAIWAKNFRTVELLLDLGADVNLPSSDRKDATTPVFDAISRAGNYELVKLFIERGAILDQEKEKLMLAAVSSGKCDEDTSLKLVKLLQAQGLDLHRSYYHSGFRRNENAFAIAIDHKKMEVAQYLKDQGCKMPSQENLPEGVKKPTAVLIEYFEEHFGAVEAESVFQFAPSPFGATIDVRVIPATENDGQVILFTEGLTEYRMNASEKESSRYAELYIELPADWQWQNLDMPMWNWPLAWLESVATELSKEDAWIETCSMFPGELPVETGAELGFTNLLLKNDHNVKRWHPGIQMVQLPFNLYRMVPLTTAEGQLEVSALVEKLDSVGVAVVDTERKCIVTGD